MDLEESMAALRQCAEKYRELHEQAGTVREDLFIAVRGIAAAYGGNPESEMPTQLTDAIRNTNMASASLREAQAFITVSREYVEHYCVGRGY